MVRDDPESHGNLEHHNRCSTWLSTQFDVGHPDAGEGEGEGENEDEAPEVEFLACEDSIVDGWKYGLRGESN